jgi:STE24 endopeptidase
LKRPWSRPLGLAATLLLVARLAVAGTAASGHETLSKPHASAFRGPDAPVSPIGKQAGFTATPTNIPAQPVTGYRLPPDKYRRAVAYSRARYRLYFASVAWELLILLVLVQRRVGVRLRDLAERVSRRRFLQAAVVTPLLLTIIGVLELPADAYGHWLALNYQQSVQGWASWLWDWSKGGLLALLLAVFLAWMLYGIVRRSPRRWWFYFWLAVIPVIVFLMFIQPLVLEPLFFRFEPLERSNPALVAEIGKVVRRAGMEIPPSRMFEMKASEKTRELNAYVTGLGASKRVVVWDTTIARMTLPQVLLVFGHEMGHYVLGHLWKGMLFAVGGLFLAFYLAYRAVNWVLPRWGAGMRGASDWASLPLLLWILCFLSFVASPIFNGYSRYLEHQADVYGLEVTHGIVPNNQQVDAQTFQILGEVDLSDPNPSRFIEFWLYSHPSISERIDFALHYDPWSKGGKPQFVR